MKGCVTKRGKTWVVRICLGRNPDTKKLKWLYKSIGTEKEAQAFNARTIAEMDTGVGKRSHPKTLILGPPAFKKKSLSAPTSEITLAGTGGRKTGTLPSCTPHRCHRPSRGQPGRRSVNSARSFGRYTSRTYSSMTYLCHIRNRHRSERSARLDTFRRGNEAGCPAYGDFWRHQAWSAQPPTAAIEPGGWLSRNSARSTRGCSPLSGWSAAFASVTPEHGDF